MKINLEEKFRQIRGYWQPHIVAELNGQVVKIARLKGEFVWHKHDLEDELFWVIQGRLTIELRDKSVQLSPGEIFVVPRGVEHKPIAREEVHLVLFEPAGVINTGDQESSHLTAPTDVKI